MNVSVSTTSRRPAGRSIGLNCYVVAGVRPDIPLSAVFRGIGPFFICDILTLGLFLAFPEIITWLPDKMINR